MKASQLDDIEVTLKKLTGIEFHIWVDGNVYNCHFITYGENRVEEVIAAGDLDPDRMPSFIRIIKTRHLELFL